MNAAINKNDAMQGSEDRELNVAELEAVSGGSAPAPASPDKSTVANLDEDAEKKIHHHIKTDHVGKHG